MALRRLRRFFYLQISGIMSLCTRIILLRCFLPCECLGLPQRSFVSLPNLTPWMNPAEGNDCERT